MKKSLLPGILLTLLLALTACSHAADFSRSTPAAELVTASVLSETVTATPRAALSFSAPSGFYAEPFDLVLECSVEGAEIYYTLDGSIPGNRSARYDGPITLSDRSCEPNRLSAYAGISRDFDFTPENVHKANVLRAVAYYPDGTVSDISCATYFIGLDREALYGKSPVISLITEEENLFDYETGIYILGKAYDEWVEENPDNASQPFYRVIGNYSGRGKEWERPVSFEIFGSDGTSNYGMDMGLRIKGSASRTYYQKSFKLIAREEYGGELIDFALIPGNERSDGAGSICSYRSIVLRNGGNDWRITKLRDPYLQSLVSCRSLETQQTVPCAVYLNGEYWGCYILTEEYSASYFSDNFGIDRDNAVVIKCGEAEEGDKEDLSLFLELYDFIAHSDMTDGDNYKKAGELLDLTGFAEYVAFQTYIGNRDSFIVNNNWALWRARETDSAIDSADGKWRFLVFDTEYSAGLYSNGQGYGDNDLQKLLDTEGEDYVREEHSGKIVCHYLLEMFFSLYRNGEFKHELINTLCDMRNCDFESSRALDVLSQLADEYAVLMDESIRRNGAAGEALQDPSAYYADRIAGLATFMTERYSCFPELIRDAFDLQEPCSVSIRAEENCAGTVMVNNTKPDLPALTDCTFTGEYFREYPITVTALPSEGYEFAGWDISGGEADTNGPTATVTLTGDCEITALFCREGGIR